MDQSKQNTLDTTLQRMLVCLYKFQWMLYISCTQNMQQTHDRSFSIRPLFAYIQYKYMTLRKDYRRILTADCVDTASYVFGVRIGVAEDLVA